MSQSAAPPRFVKKITTRRQGDPNLVFCVLAHFFRQKRVAITYPKVIILFPGNTLDHPPVLANTISPHDQHSRNRRVFLLPALLVLAAAAALSVDVPIASTFRPWVHPTTIRDMQIHAYLGYLDIFETFGHGLGVLYIVITLHQLDPSRRWAIPRVICCALAAGGAADLLKMCVIRLRPTISPTPFTASCGTPSPVVADV